MALDYGYAQKGVIFHEGLLKIGENFVRESLQSPLKKSMGKTEFLFSMATANMQMGVILGIQCGKDNQSIIDGSFFEKISSIEKSFFILCKYLLEEYGITQEKWCEFRKVIIPQWNSLIAPCTNTSKEKDCVFKLQMAYFLLGVSIGIEKFEP